MTQYSHSSGRLISVNENTRLGWHILEACPGCHSSNLNLVDTHDKRQFRFLDQTVNVPGGAINFYCCQRCGLIYRSPQPSKDLLEEIFKNTKVNPWGKRYSYKAEVSWFESIVEHASGGFDLLDVGAADGGLLLAVPAHLGRRSAMDVADFGAGTAVSGDGEFIRGWLDDDDCEWSGRPYSLVSCFDIFEHLHRPAVAFRRLAEIVSVGGVLVVETGDSDFWGPRKNFGKWWYSDLLEHNVFWNKRSLEFLAASNGFALRSLITVRHKSWRERSAFGKVFQLAKIGVNAVAPGLYREAGKAFGVSVASRPRSPFPQDHLRAVFVRV